jgi:hypothetical protein
LVLKSLVNILIKRKEKNEMQKIVKKIIKYIIIGFIAILIFGAGFISGCAYSGRTIDSLERGSRELQNSIEQYSTTAETLRSERIELNRRSSDIESEVVELGTEVSEIVDIGSGLESGLRDVYGELSNSRQGIHGVEEGLSGLHSEIQSYIEGAENP